MPRRNKDLIDRKFHALIGEVVVRFGQIEDSLRHRVSQYMSPALDDWTGASLLSRIRFTELIEMYDLLIGHALSEVETNEELPPERHAAVREELKGLCKELSNVNERRNAVVHSAYFEEVFVSDGRVLGRALSAFKPNRRALDLKEFMNPFQDVHEEIERLRKDLDHAHVRLIKLDNSIVPHMNALWLAFALRVVELQKAGKLEHPEFRLRFPGLRIG
ncbi:MAG: hypothetical protein WD696_18695 [Bryobacteraceae bacterium]